MNATDREHYRQSLEALAVRQFGGDPDLVVAVVFTRDGRWQVELRDRAGGWLLESIPADQVLLAAASRQDIASGDIQLDA